MQQGDFIRAFAALAAAGAGAGLALAGAAITGNLGASTTIDHFAAAPAQAPVKPAAAVGLSVQQIYRLDAPGVVHLTSSPTPRALGSGFVIDKAGHIVTSNLVLAGASSVQVSFSGANALEARVVGNDPSTDVALLQVVAHSRSLSPLPLGDSDDVQVGDSVVAIGNPISLSRTASTGIVSAVERGIDAPAIAGHAISTGAVTSANSGGPVINTRGQVIGVGSRVSTAIPIDVVKSVVAQLIRTGRVEHAFLGLEAVPVTEGLAHAFGLPCDYGLLVEGVRSGSGAALAGLRAGSNPVIVAGESYLLGGDIVVAANGTPITNEASLRNVVQSMKPGERLTLGIWRGRSKHTVHVTLGRPPG